MTQKQEDPVISTSDSLFTPIHSFNVYILSTYPVLGSVLIITDALGWTKAFICSGNILS